MTLWRTVGEIKGLTLAGAPCPNLGDKGCRLPEAERPAGCRSYLCDISEAVAHGKISREDGLRCRDLRQQKEAIKQARPDMLPEGTIVRVGKEVGVIVYSNMFHDALVYGVLLDDGVWDVVAERVVQISKETP